MTYPPPGKSRANLFAIIGIAVVLVVGGVLAIVVASSGDSDGATARATPTTTADTADTRIAAARDAALDDGEAAIEVFNSVDYRDVEADLDRWESVATGGLLAEVRKNRQRYVTQVTNAKSASTATVLDLALTDLDERAGTARLIAAMSVDVTIEGQQPTKKRVRMTAELERTDDGWKVSEIGTM